MTFLKAVERAPTERGVSCQFRCRGFAPEWPEAAILVSGGERRLAARRVRIVGRELDEGVGDPFAVSQVRLHAVGDGVLPKIRNRPGAKRAVDVR